MQAASTSRSTQSRVSRLDALAFALLALMPLGMALVNRSAQPLLAAAALAAFAARAQAGDLGQIRNRMAELARTPIGLGCLAFLLFAGLSIAWSHHPKTSLGAFGELVASGGAALLLHLALPARVPVWAVKLAAIGMAIGCLTIAAELSTGMSFRAGLGIRNYTFIFKRSVTAMLILFWPIAAYLWVTEKRSVAVASGLLLGIAVYLAHSSGAAFGFAVGLLAAAVAVPDRRIGSRIVAGALATAMLIAPVAGDLATRLLPAGVVEKLDFAHADQRIGVWQSFGEVVKRRPLGGAGFGTSPVMASEPVADEVPPERRVLLGAWHPHNGYLQVWAETGAVGALLFGFALVSAALALGRMPQASGAASCAVMASAAAIMLVGHGLWQGWWSAVLGAAAIWLARLPGEIVDRHSGFREAKARNP